MSRKRVAYVTNGGKECVANRGRWRILMVAQCIVSINVISNEKHRRNSV
jgi:hypothetical protein